MPISPSAAHMEALISRVRRRLPRAVWQEAFEQHAGRGVIFEEHVLTLLHADLDQPLQDEEAEQLQRGVRGLAARFDGKSDHTAAPSTLTLFRQPRHALRMAIALQQGEHGPHFRTGLYTGPCVLGIFRAQERHWAVVVGPQRAQVGALAWSAPAGSISVCSTTRRALGDRLHRDRSGALLTQTFNGETLVQASVTLSPSTRRLETACADAA